MSNDRRLAVRAPGTPLIVGTGEDVVTGALHPLLENAVRHAAHDVEIRLARAAGGDVVAVAQRGGRVELRLPS